MGANFKFVQNTACEFFPCHENIEEDKFNCLFCYCPLYTLKDECGGNPEFLADGTKDCMNCTVTHLKDSGFAHVMSKIEGILELGKKQSK